MNLLSALMYIMVAIILAAAGYKLRKSLYYAMAGFIAVLAVLKLFV